MDDAGKLERPAQSDDEPPPRHGWRLAIFGLIFTLLAFVVQINYSLYVSTITDLAILITAGLAVAWTADQFYQWWLTRHRPGGLPTATATSVILILLLLLMAQPPVTALHHHDCRFGPFGISLGSNWIRIEPLNVQETHRYTLTVDWGPRWVQVTESLNKPTYFTLKQREVRSEASAGITVEPPAYIACGSGSPPPGEPQIALRGWQSGKAPSPATTR